MTSSLTRPEPSRVQRGPPCAVPAWLRLTSVLRTAFFNIGEADIAAAVENAEDEHTVDLNGEGNADAAAKADQTHPRCKIVALRSPLGERGEAKTIGFDAADKLERPVRACLLSNEVGKLVELTHRARVKDDTVVHLARAAVRV